ncbi:polysaccharide deacetylase family protein [Deinococcus taeanensis]|uniref:polysaccharide deacetylase family protein n=1 Tax=Deinococcus taeanensis TaxID=2737050 RepID=UPI001CDB54C4|nr:polysaccharide deacetylase family protein [Deinococcus taeanensis]UBV43725.1 polysaccharide deacetylase family protein [Deinococcus taeanensis]
MKAGRRVLLGTVVWLGTYIGLPYLLSQRGGLGLIRSGRGARQVALTFDDGPDPATTPAVLDALRAAGVHAAFFVLPEQAERHPALLRQLLDEGHEVHPHGNLHRHAWFLTPWRAFRDPGDAARRIARLTGRRATRQRPPHGGYTLATLLGQRATGLTGVHWTVEARDWAPDATPQGVRSAVRQQVHPGAIIVLHDAGPGGRTTPTALPGILRDLLEQGYDVVPLQELQGARPGRWQDLAGALRGRH